MAQPTPTHLVLGPDERQAVPALALRPERPRQRRRLRRRVPEGERVPEADRRRRPGASRVCSPFALALRGGLQLELARGRVAVFVAFAGEARRPLVGREPGGGAPAGEEARVARVGAHPLPVRQRHQADARAARLAHVEEHRRPPAPERPQAVARGRGAQRRALPRRAPRRPCAAPQERRQQQQQQPGGGEQRQRSPGPVPALRSPGRPGGQQPRVPGRLPLSPPRERHAGGRGTRRQDGDGVVQGPPAPARRAPRPEPSGRPRQFRGFRFRPCLHLSRCRWAAGAGNDVAGDGGRGPTRGPWVSLWFPKKKRTTKSAAPNFNCYRSYAAAAFGLAVCSYFVSPPRPHAFDRLGAGEREGERARQSPTRCSLAGVAATPAPLTSRKRSRR